MEPAEPRVLKCSPEVLARSKRYREANRERVRELSRLNYRKHREKRIAASAAWAKAHPERHAASARRQRERNGRDYSRDMNLRCKYGVSLIEYEKMVSERGGLCDICKKKPSGKRHHSVLHIDHAHATNKNRGLLCGPCNTAIGLLREDTSLLIAAIAYLRKHGSAQDSAEENIQVAGTSDRGRSA